MLLTSALLFLLFLVVLSLFLMFVSSYKLEVRYKYVSVICFVWNCFGREEWVHFWERITVFLVELLFMFLTFNKNEDTLSAKIQWQPLLYAIILGCHIACCTFLECHVWVYPGCFWRLGGSRCRLCCCCWCWWHRALRRAVWLTAKVLSLQLGVTLEPLQNSHLTLLYCRHKQSAELTATGNQ